VERLEPRALLATWFVDASNLSGVEDGSQAHPFHLIQAAIDHSATSGDKVSVAPGTYAEALTIPHPLTLLGPSAGLDPNTGTRGPEAVVVPPVNNPSAGDLILVTGSGVTIDGLTLDGSNPTLAGGTPLNGVSSHPASGVSNVDSFGKLTPVSGLTVQNDVIRNLTAFGVLADNNDFSPRPSRSRRATRSATTGSTTSRPSRPRRAGGSASRTASTPTSPATC
jgi:hypothetical protein